MKHPLQDAIVAFRATQDGASVQSLIPYTGFVGLRTVPDGDGIRTILEPRPGNIGNTQIGAVHGGVVGALLEHAAIMQLFFQVDCARPPKTINVSIDYLRPCRADRETVATARVVKQGRRIANVRIEAFQDDPSRPVAAAHAHFLLD